MKQNTELLSSSILSDIHAHIRETIADQPPASILSLGNSLAYNLRPGGNADQKLRNLTIDDYNRRARKLPEWAAEHPTPAHAYDARMAA